MNIQNFYDWLDCQPLPVGVQILPKLIVGSLWMNPAGGVLYRLAYTEAGEFQLISHDSLELSFSGSDTLTRKEMTALLTHFIHVRRDAIDRMTVQTYCQVCLAPLHRVFARADSPLWISTFTNPERHRCFHYLGRVRTH